MTPLYVVGKHVLKGVSEFQLFAGQETNENESKRKENLNQRGENEKK